MNTTKKQSLFAQQMKLNRTEAKSGPVFDDIIKEKTKEEIEILENSSFITSDKGFPEAIGLFSQITPIENPESADISQEMSMIHQENLKKLSKMTESEVKQSLQEIESLIDPSAIEILRKRGRNKLKASIIELTSNKQEKNDIKDIKEEEIIKLQNESNRTCMHSTVLDHVYDKIRYDEEGNIVQKYENSH